MFETIPILIQELIYNEMFLTVGSCLHRAGRVHKTAFLIVVFRALWLLFFGGNDDRAIFCLTIKTAFLRRPGRCDTSHLSDFNETWSNILSETILNAKSVQSQVIVNRLSNNCHPRPSYNDKNSQTGV